MQQRVSMFCPRFHFGSWNLIFGFLILHPRPNALELSQSRIQREHPVIIACDRLKSIVMELFAVAGSSAVECERIAHYLVEANLVGHDSHGVIRIPAYIGWVRAGKVVVNQVPDVVFENDVIAIVDARFGFGQVMGELAIKLGIRKATRQGVSVVALRNSGHLGRIGDFAELAARAGNVSLHFVNTSGGGILVTPFGGTQRRLSANPIAAGVPVAGSAPIILDMSTCVIAEGKVKVALNAGALVPEGCLLDSEGRPSREPKALYGPPPGALLPLGGHKGYGLSVIVEVLAGALTGGGCSHFGVDRVSNNMLSIIVDPIAFQSGDAFGTEIRALIEHIKSSKTVTPDGEILVPGEPEARTKARRLREGIELDDTTWGQLVATGRSLGVAIAASPDA
jgi:uncharacterized oxidoreductase